MNTVRTIPTAMTWEILAHGSWALLSAFFGAIAFPAIILMALRFDGRINPDDPSMIVMHVVMSGMMNAMVRIVMNTVAMSCSAVIMIEAAQL